MVHSIGQTIKKLRKEHNLTQEELAEQLNVTAQAVSKWENETGLPDISQVVPLANVFGVPTNVLFGTANVNCDEEVERIIICKNAKHYNKREHLETPLLRECTFRYFGESMNIRGHMDYLDRPEFAPLHDHPRYKELVEKINSME